MKKDVIIAILATFVLTITLFTVIPIYSQSVGDYDPWLDVNDDGAIEMKDVASVARAYGTNGTPISKTALLLELQDRIATLESRVNTGIISVSPIHFGDIGGSQTLGAPQLSVGGRWAFVHFPHNAIITNVTAYLWDNSTSHRLELFLSGFNVKEQYMLWSLAHIDTTDLGAVQEIQQLYDDTIRLDYAQIDNKNCVYGLYLIQTSGYPLTNLHSVVIEYTY